MFLCLLCFFLVISAEQLYVGKNLPQSAIEKARLGGAYYGTYRNGLSILSISNEFVEPLEVDKSLSRHLYVFELGSGDQGFSQVQSFTQIFPAKIIYCTANKDECIIQILDATLTSLTLDYELSKQFPLIEDIILVSNEPYRSNVFSEFVYPQAVSTVDPRIAAALTLVDLQSLNNTITWLSNYWSRQSASEGAQLAQEWLGDQFLNSGATVSYQKFNQTYSANVIGSFRGRVASPVIVVGAHYDSRSTNSSDPTQRAPGAVDNGSGTAALVEIAKVLQKSQFLTHYPITLVAFSGEEQGLLGSAAYAKSLSSGSVYAMLNADMLAWRLPNTSVVTLGFKDMYVTRTLTDLCMTLSTLYVPSIQIANSSSCCSDYRSFFEQGFPAVGFFQNQGNASNYPAYHTQNDLPSQVDWTQQVLETQAVLASLLTLAEIQ